MDFQPILNQYRAGYLECMHYGIACVVDEEGISHVIGNPDWYSFYRSASKPIQSLPTLMEGLHEKYSLTKEETAIFSGSHWGEKRHVELLESICQKTGLNENDMVMLPTYPLNGDVKSELIRNGMPPRKIYHNCSGKHLSLMLLSRELGENPKDYWQVNSKAQTAILRVVSQMTDVSADQIHIGVDGCGVPVYGVPIHAIAKSFLRLACPDLVKDQSLAAAICDNRSCIQAAPMALDGEKGPCACMSRTGDIIAKAGALGVYVFGCESERLAVVVKMSDGSDAKAAFCATSILENLGYSDLNMLRDLKQICPAEIYNDNRILVGHQEFTAAEAFAK